MAQFINPAMCEITEDLFFNDPYQIHERNNYPAELEADVAALRDDAQLKLAVAALKHRFFAHAEALLHGDIHSGSIFVAEGSLKAIDAEFGYFGPIGFDIGTAIGNLLLNYCGLPGQLGIRDAAAAREQRLNDIHQLWTTFAERFRGAGGGEKTPRRGAGLPRLRLRLSEESLGGRGRLLRQRTDPPQRRTVARRGYRHYPRTTPCVMSACATPLPPGRALIVLAERIDSVDELLARVRQYS